MRVYRRFDKQSHMEEFLSGEIRFTHPLNYIINNTPPTGDHSEGVLQNINTYGDGDAILCPMILSTSKKLKDGNYIVSFDIECLVNSLNKYLENPKNYIKTDYLPAFISHDEMKYVDNNNPPLEAPTGEHSIFIKNFDPIYQNQDEYRFVLLRPNELRLFNEKCEAGELVGVYEKAIELDKKRISGELSLADVFERIKRFGKITTVITIPIEWKERPSIEKSKT